MSSARRDENRLTRDDRHRIRVALAARFVLMGKAPIVTVDERLGYRLEAAHAIHVGLSDLRDSEHAWIGETIDALTS